MANDDLMSSLKGMLGENADEKINAVMNMLKGDSTSISDDATTSYTENEDNREKRESVNSSEVFPISGEGLEYLTKIKGIIDEMGNTNDSRSQLLMSLRPYMRETRKRSIDNAVKILNLSRFSGMFKI